MTQPTIKRPTLEEKRSNTQLIEAFTALFSAKNSKLLMDLFHPQGTYIAGRSKDALYGYFYEILETDLGVNLHFLAKVNHGFSSDRRPGEHVLEFRFVNYDPFTDFITEDDFASGKELGDPCNAKLKECVYHYALTFKDKKIYTLREPKKYVSSIERFVQEN